MSARHSDSIIDLTIPYDWSNRNIQHQYEIIVVDDDDSIGAESPVKSRKKKVKKTVRGKNDVKPSPNKVLQKKKSTNNSRSIGYCPICLDELWEKPLASTKCGHVFCMKCLEQSLRHDSKCPTCRKKLPMNSYHPLYL